MHYSRLLLSRPGSFHADQSQQLTISRLIDAYRRLLPCLPDFHPWAARCLKDHDCKAMNEVNWRVAGGPSCSTPLRTRIRFWSVSAPRTRIPDPLSSLASVETAIGRLEMLVHPLWRRHWDASSDKSWMLRGRLGAKARLSKAFGHVLVLPKNQPGADWRVLQEIVKADPSKEMYKGPPLVPWCLPNTADRPQRLAWTVGRLDLNGHFPTSTTDPQPMGKVPGVPPHSVNRIVSVVSAPRTRIP
eukprot:gene23607-9137_t